jgi:hypothetical protein
LEDGVLRLGRGDLLLAMVAREVLLETGVRHEHRPGKREKMKLT